MLGSYRFDMFDMFYAVDHQRDVRPVLRCASHSGKIMLVPGRIANQQVLESLRGEIGGLQRAIAHDALKTGIRRENAPQDAGAANRLGGQTNMFAMRTAGNVLDVLI